MTVRNMERCNRVDTVTGRNLAAGVRGQGLDEVGKNRINVYTQHTQSLLRERNVCPSAGSQTKEQLDVRRTRSCARVRDAAAQLHKNIKYIVGSHGETARHKTPPRVVGRDMR